jgi:hypothetical protein
VTKIPKPEKNVRIRISNTAKKFSSIGDRTRICIRMFWISNSEPLPAQAVLLDLEGERWAAGKAGNLEVGPQGRLGEHAEVGHLQHPRHVHKVLNHVLGTHFQVGSGEGFHHLQGIMTVWNN